MSLGFPERADTDREGSPNKSEEGRMTVQLHPAQTTATEAHDALGTPEKVGVVPPPAARCDDVVRHMRKRAAEGDVAFPLVAPPVPAGLDWLADMTAGRDAAEQRLNHLLF